MLNLYHKYKSFIAHNFLAGLSTVIKSLTQIFILKITAVYLGTAGLGVIGQALSCFVIFQNFFNGGILNYTITSWAAASSEIEKKRIIGTVSLWSLVVAVISFSIMLVFSEKLSIVIFQENIYGWFFILLGSASVFLSMLLFGNGIISSNKGVKNLVLANLGTLVIGGTSFVFLMNYRGLKGALLGLFSFYVIQGILFFVLAYRKYRLNFNFFIPNFSKIEFKKLLGFILLIAISGVLLNLYQIYLRTYMLNELMMSWSDVGVWQAITKISDVIISFVAVTLMTSYLPSLSNSLTDGAARQIVQDSIKGILVLILLSCFIVAILAPFVLEVVYSRELRIAAPLLRLQMLGDVFKFSTCIFSYYFMARAKVVILLIYETTCVSILTFVSLILVSKYSLKGLVVANIISGFIALTLGYILYRVLEKNQKWRLR